MTSDVQFVLLGYALGVIPAARSSQILVAWLGKRLGVEPKKVEEYDEATEKGDSDS